VTSTGRFDTSRPNFSSTPNLVILVSDHPTQNARKYRHAGCTRWFVPLDDAPPLTTDDERECDGCAQVLPCQPIDNAWSDSVSV
jgi:hypothetical protein